MAFRILLVEDDAKLGQQVLEQLREAGHEAAWLRDGASALRVEPRDYGLLVLDLMLPGTHGLDVLKHWRTRSDSPVLVLSAKTDTAIKVRALELGADDYLTKPFWPEELMARVTARLRRPVLAREGVLESGTIRVDLNARRVHVEEREIELTRVECTLDVHVSRLRKKLGPAGARIETVWGVGYRLAAGGST
jgi:two-component system response regulator MtrA